jgi:L-ascorbate metabolism protein UlaG (beta-lactamase superfamily)
MMRLAKCCNLDHLAFSPEAWRMRRGFLTVWLMLVAVFATTAAFAQLPVKSAPGEPACEPHIAQLGPMQGLPIRRANFAADRLKLTFVGHSTFLIESPQGVTVATDYNDYIRPSTTPQVATMNKAHSTHYSNAPDPGIQQVLRGWNPKGGRVDHDITLGDLRIRNVQTNIRDYSGDTLDYGNSIFIFEIGDLCVGHLGHLHHKLELEHIKALGRIDVLLVPVDGNYTMDLDGMIDVVRIVQARIVIPMHYFGMGTLSRFTQRASETMDIVKRDTPVEFISKATLPMKPAVIILPGR